jgi:hypothetical protein
MSTMTRPFDIAEQHVLFPEAFEPRLSPLHVRHVETPPARAPAPPPAAAVPPPGEDAPRSLEAALATLLPGKDVSVRYTENRTVILSLRRGPSGSSILRAHRCFAHAPDRVAEAAVRLYLMRTSPGERRRLTGLVTRWHQEAAAPPPSVDNCEIRKGEHHDLATILARVNAEWFERKLDLDITFGVRVARRLMGRHERRQPRSLVVINPILDHDWITNWYLEYLVFHECLHEVVPPVPDGHRLLLHPPEFRLRERRHPSRDRALVYERWITGPAWPTLRAAAYKKIQRTSPSATRTRSAARTRRDVRGSDGSGNASP